MLRDAFLASLPAPRREAFASSPRLEDILRSAIEIARDALPESPLDEGAFLETLAKTFDDDDVAAADLESLHVADLRLAFSCARGDDAAIRAFHASFTADLDLAIAKSPRLGVSRDEFRQLVITKLFVGEAGKAPRIASYSGRGALKGWVRVTAARLVVDLSRTRSEEIAVEDLDRADREGAPDAELAFLRHAYAAHVPAAFDEALRHLSPRQRNLLRQRYLHGLGADKLAPLYGVHRATAFGWLEDARKALLAQVRVALAARVPGTALESVVGVLGSQLHVSVGRLLEHALEEEPARR